MKKVSILGIKIHKITVDQAIEKVADFVKEKTPHQIVTVNPEFIMIAQKDREFKKVLKEADLAVADGSGIIWASKIVYHPLSERIAGVDLVEKMAKLAHQNRFSIFFLGAKEGIAQKTSQILKDKYPKMKVAGYEAGSPHDLSLLGRIKKKKPDILLVAFGAPKQDKWIYKFKNSLGIPVMMGVGGSFDLISGAVPRAPKWMQNAGLEWLYRLYREPKRIKRQLSLVKFVYLILKNKSKR